MYKILKDGNVIESEIPGRYAGCKKTGIFGNITPKYVCSYGLQMLKESRVFFSTLEDAVIQGYRPCRACKPINKLEFMSIKRLTPFSTLDDFSRAKPIRVSDKTFKFDGNSVNDTKHVVIIK
jgi:hypothetical protein